MNGTARWLALLLVVATTAAAGAGAHFTARAAIEQNRRDIASLRDMGTRLRRVENVVIKIATRQGIDVAVE